jgi:hypothetical protein
LFLAFKVRFLEQSPPLFQQWRIVMLPQECKFGMKVYFGRKNGQKTLAEVIKLNPTRAKVKTLEQRGQGRGSAIGSVWNVAYEALTAAPTDAKPGETVVFVAPPLVEPMKYNPFDQKNGLYSCLANAYNALEPESLTCDGEASRGQIVAKQREYQRQIKGLNYAIGREIDAMSIFDWDLSRQEYEQEYERKRAEQFVPPTRNSTGLVGDPQ